MTLRDNPQDITLWTTTPDGFGGYTFAAPLLIKGRWEDKSETIRNSTGDETVSVSVVYLDTDVSQGDYIAQGDQTATADPTTLQNAEEVKQFDRIPDLRQISVQRKARL